MSNEICGLKGLEFLKCNKFLLLYYDNKNIKKHKKKKWTPVKLSYCPSKATERMLY